MLHHLLKDRARRDPERVAVICDGRHTTYAELDTLSEAAAAALATRGVGHGDRVGLYMDKSALALAVMQGALRIGACYVPIDSMSPLERVRAIIEACDMRVVATHESLKARLYDAGVVEGRILSLHSDDLCDSGRVDRAERVENPEDIAYILYTSGSTGRPKGVCISHRAALAFILSASEIVGATASDRFANQAPFHFDISVLDLYVPITVGAAVVLLRDQLTHAPSALVERVVRDEVTIWYSVPSVAVMMIEQGALLTQQTQLRLLIFGGEVFPLPALRRLRLAFPDARILNVYGPTETNMCTYYEVRQIAADSDPLPIGAACCGARLWALTDEGTRAESGEVGELVVQGPTVMTGYWGSPPLADRRYRTGDIVRVSDDGQYRFLGRRDALVKLRGHRVELGEIEATLLSHSAIREAAVSVVGEGMNARLIAWVALRSQLTAKEVRKFMVRKVPRYMVPDEFKFFELLPRLPNGKLNRAGMTGAGV